MKNLHFCEREKDNLLLIKNSPVGTKLDTYRTGWVPTLYTGDIINLTERIPNEKDKILVTARVEYVFPFEFSELSKEIKHQMEVSYGRWFNDHHWFFNIGLIIIENSFK